jgi:hypothetical protein
VTITFEMFLLFGSLPIILIITVGIAGHYKRRKSLIPRRLEFIGETTNREYFIARDPDLYFLERCADKWVERSPGGSDPTQKQLAPSIDFSNKNVAQKPILEIRSGEDPGAELWYGILLSRKKSMT